MTQSCRQNNLAIFAYGSLLSDPGERIGEHIIERISCPSPWPIEYARRAKLRGYGPTLAIHETGGIVQGQLLVSDLEPAALDELTEWIWRSEGRPPRDRLKQMKYRGFSCVLYCDLEATLRNEEINPESLAQFAIESVSHSPQRNAVRYLAQNLEQGIITPLTYAYRDAILRRTQAVNLTDAERRLLNRLRGLRFKRKRG